MKTRRGARGFPGAGGAKGDAGVAGERGERGQRGLSATKRWLVRDSPLAYLMAAIALLGALLTAAMTWQSINDRVSALERDHIFHFGKDKD